MSDLTAFLLARIAEYEAAAREMGDWRHLDGLFNELLYEWNAPDDLEDDPDSKDAAKMSAWLVTKKGIPARVLAECAAKRAVVAECCDALGEPELGPQYRVLRALARPYADHPDFDEAWRA